MGLVGPLGASFAVISTVVIVAGVGALVLIGVFWPGTGAEQVDWHPARSPEAAATDEVDDMTQMLAATNLGRRRRGLPELTEDDLALRVMKDQQELRAMRGRAAERADASGANDPAPPPERDDA